MLFGKNRPKKFRISRDRDKPDSRKKENESSDEKNPYEGLSDEERREEIRRRIKFHSHRQNRKTGERSMLWLFAMLILIGMLIWYLASM